MYDEGRCDDWRLTFLVDNFVRDFFDTVVALFTTGSRDGAIPDISLMQFYYVLVGSACVFAMAPECRMLTGEDPFTDEVIDAQANAIAMLLTTAD